MQQVCKAFCSDSVVAVPSPALHPANFQHASIRITGLSPSSRVNTLGFGATPHNTSKVPLPDLTLQQWDGVAFTICPLQRRPKYKPTCIYGLLQSHLLWYRPALLPCFCPLTVGFPLHSHCVLQRRMHPFLAGGRAVQVAWGSGWYPFFYDWHGLYQSGVVDAKEWKNNRFKFF